MRLLPHSFCSNLCYIIIIGLSYKIVLPGSIPPPPPVGDTSLSSNSSANAKKGGISTNMLAGVQLRAANKNADEVSPAGSRKRDRGAAQNGLVISQDLLRNVKLRKTSEDSKAGGVRDPNHPTLPFATPLRRASMLVAGKPPLPGLDFAEITTIKLKKVDANRSPGGTPLKPKTPAASRPEGPPQIMFREALRKRLQVSQFGWCWSYRSKCMIVTIFSFF